MLELHDLRRRFGDVVALDGVGFSVAPGRLTGFVGANGAGKSTTMRIVLGVLAPDAGTVRWRGAPVDLAVRRRFGSMPEERGLYPRMPLREQLVYFARLHGLDRAGARRRADGLLDELGLGDRAGDRLDALSLGNQQRVQLAVALVHDPELLVLDEPFSGLDPLAVDTMARLLRERADSGVPVLFSSHQLDLVERLCDDLVIISAGRVVAAGSTDALRDRHAGHRYRVVGGAPGWASGLAGVRVVAGSGAEVLVELDGADPQELLRRALDRGPVHAFGRVVPSLSEVFREVVA